MMKHGYSSTLRSSASVFYLALVLHRDSIIVRKMLIIGISLEFERCVRWFIPRRGPQE
jgi:hypothetical protein